METNGLAAGVDALRTRLSDAEETLRAIRQGEVDALVVSVEGRPVVFTLETADRPYRIMVESMAEGAATLSSDGVVLYANRRFADIVDRPLATVVGSRVEQFLAPGEEIPGASGRIELVRPDGTRVPVHVSSTALALDEERVTCIVATDLSAYVRAEEEIRRLNEQLERRVVERTAELAATNRELETFSYSASHDLRAPLRAIVGFSTILLETASDALDPESRRLLEHVDANARRMQALLDGLLVLSRTGRGDLQLETVDVDALVRHVVRELEPSLADRDVTIDVAALPPAEADRSLLGACFANLLENAVKFTRAHARARISVGAEIDDGRIVYFVRDDGVGFDMGHASRLFAPFQRLHKLDEYEGTGIGLATVQRIVHRHGGSIWATAEPDRGATFSFTLGSADADAEADDPAR